MIRAPKYTFGASFDYSRETDVGIIGLSANLFHSAKYYWDFENRTAQPSYTQLSGELSWAKSEDSWRVALWGRNLLNEVVYSNILTAAQGDVVGFERPRSYGVSVSTRF
jgi:iron complex outermembrane receptor protein